jgi:hypothetical protein
MSIQIVALALDANDKVIERKVVRIRPAKRRWQQLKASLPNMLEPALLLVCDGWQRRARAFG